MMDLPHSLLLVGLVLYLVSLPLVWGWAVFKTAPPDDGDRDEKTPPNSELRFWWKYRQLFLLLMFGPLITLAGLYLLLEWLQ